MSLISEALNKAQQEREKNRNSDELSYSEPPQHTTLFTKRRLIFIGAFALFVLVSVLIVNFWYQPSSVPQMQALNINPTPPPPTTKAVTAPTPLPSQPIPVEKPIIKSHSTSDMQVPQAKKFIPLPKSHNSQNSQRSHNSQNPLSPKSIHAGVTLQKESPQPPPAPMDAAAFMQEGDRWMEKNNGILAVEEYKKALALSRTTDIYLKLYTAFKSLRNPVLMRAYIDEGLSFFPRDYYLNKISAVLYIRAKEFRKAQVNINAAMTNDPGDYAIHTYQGLCYFHTGGYDNALTAFQESLQINSDAVENYYYIGLIFDNQKQYTKALEYYTAFIKLNTGNENFMHRDWVIERVRLLKENQ